MGYDFPGHLLVFLALGMNVLAGVAFTLTARGNSSMESLARRSYHAFVAFTAMAFAYLYYLFLSDNFAFKYVYEYSESTQPFFYVISAIWGGQEGTYLMWLLFCGLFGYIILHRGGPLRNEGMTFLTVVNLFFLLILTRLSPFALLPGVPPDGLGLNPLLRDPWMVIHPPVMFVGYAVVAIPFAMAVAAMFRNDYESWQTRAFPWVAVSALTLGAGNILGGYWAYKTLGWGGYWGWDPVENSSLIPWLVSLALLHGLILERRTGAMRKTNLMLAVMLFVAVIYGTFLTRSGVLADFSVHSFSDLGVSGYLVGFMLTFIVGSVALFFYRFRSIPSAPVNYNFFGSEFSLFAGTVILFIMSVVVLFWTSLPLLTTAFSDTPRAANIETYNSFAMPLAIIMAFLLSFAPAARAAEFPTGVWKTKLLVTALISIAVGVGVFHFVLESGLVFIVLFVLTATGMVMALGWFKRYKTVVISFVCFHLAIFSGLALGVEDRTHILYLALAAMALVANGISVGQRLRNGGWRTIGGQLTHVGFGIMLIGVLASSAYVSTDKIILPTGVPGDALGQKVVYEGMESHMETPNNKLKLLVGEGDDARQARPELYYSERMDGIMRKPFIQRTTGHDLYLAPAQVREAEQPTFVLRKGESRTFDPFTIGFESFSMGDHGSSGGGGMSVAAVLLVTYGDSSILVTPSVSSQAGAGGENKLVETPEEFTVGGKTYNVMIDRILANEGAVQLVIPELSEDSVPETLIMDVSKIPLINLVWIGTTLILLGSLITFLRRHREAARLA